MDNFALLAVNLIGLIGFGIFIYRMTKPKTEGNQFESEVIRLNETLSLKQEALTKAESKSEELTEKVSNLEIENARLESKMESMTESMESERKLLEEAEQKLKDAFKSLASSALEGSSKQFLDLAKATFSKESELAQKELEKKEESIEGMVKPLSDLLDRYQTQISNLEKERQKSYTTVEAELKRVIENTTMLSAETLALKNALKKPHVRGRWGEVQLKNCIELAGMSEHSDVTFQDYSTDEEGQTHIPDMTVRMPGGRLVVVDSKTPIDAFLASLEATTDEERATEMARHGRHVKDHVKRLSQRAYYEGLKESPDFTIMFLPNESFLYAALESEPDLMEEALKKKVLITTPPTLIGLLKVIRYGWNEEKLAENASRISDLGKDLHKRLVEFVEGFEKVGNSLDKAKDEYDRGYNRLRRRLIPKARQMEELGAKSVKSLPENIDLLEAPKENSPEA